MKLKDKFTELMYNQASAKLYVIIFSWYLLEVFTLPWSGAYYLAWTLLSWKVCKIAMAENSIHCYGVLLTAFCSRIYHPVVLFAQTFKYAFSAFGIIDLLATLPLYLAFRFPHAICFQLAFRLIRYSRFQVFNFWMKGKYKTALRDSSKNRVFFMFVLFQIFIGTLMYMVEGVEPSAVQQYSQQYLIGLASRLPLSGYGYNLSPFLSGILQVSCW